MKSNRLTVLFFCLVLIIVLHGNANQDQSNEKTADPKTGNGLIRKDLLVTQEQPLKMPERNIFKPDRRRTASEVQEDSGPIVPTEELSAPDEGDAEIVTGWTGQLRYIGYIGSLKRTVALIIFNGEALAVETGEQISDEITVTKISPLEVEFEGPDSMQIKAVFEGEK